MQRSGERLRWFRWCALGLALRVATLLAFHNRAYILDHLSYVYWGRLGVEQGLLRMYQRPTHPPYGIYAGGNYYAAEALYPQAPIQKHDRAQWVTRWLPGGTLRFLVPAGKGQYEYALYEPLHFNYPPLAAYLYWVLGFVHRMADSQQQPDTRLAHVLFATPAVLCDLLLAVAVARALQLLGGAVTPQLGLLLILFCPALIWDSSGWLQTDSLGLLVITGSLLLLAQNRPVSASALCGLGLMVKPQVAWVVPVVAYVALKTRSARTLALSALVGAAVVAIVSMPFLLSGGLQWFNVAYIENARLYPRLSLNAYNPWWVVSLVRVARVTGPTIATGNHPSLPLLARRGAALNDGSPWLLGVSPRMAGFALLGAALLLVVIAWYRYSRAHRPNVFILTYLIYLAAFLFPTEVHERYIIYALPLATIAAADLSSVRVGLWGLNLVALVNLTGYTLLRFPFDPGFWARHCVAIGTEVAAAVLTLLLFIAPVIEMWRAGSRRGQVGGVRCNRRPLAVGV
jgi:Gpi18-like mannosyltransferase